MRAIGWLVLLAAQLFTVGQARATTYNYIGNPYTQNTNQALFGDHMTGTLKFSFNTAGLSGIFQLHTAELQPDGSRTDSIIAELDSGLVSAVIVRMVSVIVLMDGQVTAWDIATNSFEGFFNFCGLPNCGIISESAGFGGYDQVTQICICTPPSPPTQSALSHSPGIWTLDLQTVPFGIAGAGWPSLFIFGSILVYRKRFSLTRRL